MKRSLCFAIALVFTASAAFAQRGGGPHRHRGGPAGFV